MKLRNKKTGDAVYVDFQIPLSNNNEVLGSYSVTSLKELNESFEDYTPQEPLIKNEIVRKVVRDWADVNGITVVHYIILGDGISVFSYDDIEINFIFQVEGVQDDKRYTITELCGEEE